MSGDPKDEAQTKLDEYGIEPGNIYRHYKGSLYVVVCLSIKEDTYEPMIAYRSNAKGTVWTRTLKNFTEEVDVGRSGPIDLRPRFVRESQ